MVSDSAHDTVTSAIFKRLDLPHCCSCHSEPPCKPLCAQVAVCCGQGSIVRTVVRLDETCREFGDAARVMGDTSLWAQMTAASAAIKRDVVFAASLYVA